MSHHNYLNKFHSPPETPSRKFSEDAAEHMPQKLKSEINRLDALCKNRFPSWISIGESLWTYITHEEKLGNIHPGMKVLELGSGISSSTKIWSNKGYPIVGIELNEQITAMAKDGLKQRIELQNAPIRLINGSYYLREYINDMNKNKNSKASQLEAELIKHKSKKQIKDTFYKLCTKDVYENNNTSIKDFDIIYGYMWSYQFPSVFEMFKKYAKDDAMFMAIGPRHREIAEALGLKAEKGSHIYRK